MFTPPEPLGYFKFQYSLNSTGTRFSHSVVDKLPMLHYRFAEGSNWKANDYRITTKIDAASKWFDNYWKLRPAAQSFVNQGVYEAELQEVIVEAYMKLNEKWNKKLELEFEAHFEDDLLGFMSGKKQNDKT